MRSAFVEETRAHYSNPRGGIRSVSPASRIFQASRPASGTLECHQRSLRHRSPARAPSLQAQRAFKTDAGRTPRCPLYAHRRKTRRGFLRIAKLPYEQNRRGGPDRLRKYRCGDRDLGVKNDEEIRILRGYPPSCSVPGKRVSCTIPKGYGSISRDLSQNHPSRKGRNVFFVSLSSLPLCWESSRPSAKDRARRGGERRGIGQGNSDKKGERGNRTKKRDSPP